jgi:hypothetical protein
VRVEKDELFTAVCVGVMLAAATQAVLVVAPVVWAWLLR